MAEIPAYVYLDVWFALGGTGIGFERMWDESGRTPADTWAQLMAVISGRIEALLKDSNPPIGPEFETLILGYRGTRIGGHDVA